MLGYEKADFDYLELEMFIGEKLMEGKMLPIQIINSGLRICADRKVIQQAIHEFQEDERKMKWCENKGHKIVSESHGGPESGYESGYCKRCGWSFDIRMY